MPEKKKAMLYDQTAVAYNPAAVGAPPEQKCANCRWFCSAGEYPPGEDEPATANGCHLVYSYPTSIQPTGWCNQWTSLPEPIPLNPMPVVVIENAPEPPEALPSPEVEMQMSTDGRKTTIIGPGLIERVLDVFRGSREKASEHIGFKALGNGYYFAPFTNNFEDREKEILSHEAHRRYVKRVQAGLVDMPELWIHHIPGTRHGKALYVGMTDHTVFAVGKFDDTPLGRLMEKTYLGMKPGTLAMSHGFKYPAWAKKDGVYYDYNTFETTTLQPGSAANPYTPFVAIESEKEFEMPLDDKAKAQIRQTFPGPVGENILSLVSQVEVGEGKVKELLGAKYKDFADLTTADKKKDAPNVDTLDSIKALLPGMVEGYSEVLQFVQAMDKKLDTLSAENADMKKALALAPTPASKAEGTVVESGTEATTAKGEIEKKSGANNPYASLFPDLIKS